MDNRNLSDDQFGGAFRYDPRSVVSMAVAHRSQEPPTSSGLPKFWSEDASDEGSACGSACASGLAAGQGMREVGKQERLLPEQFPEGERHLLAGPQFQHASVDEDEIFMSSGGRSKHIVGVAPRFGEDAADPRYGAGEIADVGQQGCTTCGGPTIPGGIGDPWSKRRPWEN